MGISWQSNEFKIGINMARAVSAGAYTAGVLDFLMEALEEWQNSKDALRAYIANPGTGAPPAAVPLHDVKIEIFTGASAGGMCAAIASVMVQQDFVHIRTGMERNTNNVFYESWVNTIDIRELLKAQDLAGGGPLTSLLDSTIIDTIAATALTPGTPVRRPYISEQLTLMLTLSNVRGTPYQLYTDPDPAVEEFIEYFGDKLRFETTQGDAPASTPSAKPLPSGAPGAGAWPLLQEAAKATGAFPIFLAPRILTRDTADYVKPPWETFEAAARTGPVTPDFAVPAPAEWTTLNVDGGVTDNDPFELAHDFLASRNPRAQEGHNPPDALEANCAVITVAPFPASDRFNPQFDAKAESNIWKMLGKLASVLISQSRFLGESLASLTSGVSFSRFVIALSDPAQTAGQDQGRALQCGLLGAFGGFLDRGFRKHDFLLGRRNCQKFLMTNFCLPTGNPAVAAGITSAGAFASQMGAFLVDPPNATAQPQARAWMPLIPLVGTAAREVPEPVREQIALGSLDEIAGLAVERIKAVKSPLLEGAPWIVRALAAAAFTWPLSIAIKGKFRKALSESLGPNVEGQQG